MIITSKDDDYRPPERSSPAPRNFFQTHLAGMVTGRVCAGREAAVARDIGLVGKGWRDDNLKRSSARLGAARGMCVARVN